MIIDEIFNGWMGPIIFDTWSGGCAKCLVTAAGIQCLCGVTWRVCGFEPSQEGCCNRQSSRTISHNWIWGKIFVEMNERNGGKRLFFSLNRCQSRRQSKARNRGWREKIPFVFLGWFCFRRTLASFILLALKGVNCVFHELVYSLEKWSFKRFFQIMLKKITPILLEICNTRKKITMYFDNYFKNSIAHLSNIS